MRLLLWTLTIGLALAGIAIWADYRLPGAGLIAKGCIILAVLACPLLWAKEDGLISGLTAGLVFTGRDRLMLSLALVLAAPVMLPWPL